MSAYAETCASIANVYWNSRMFYLNRRCAVFRCAGTHLV
ncbi:MAG: hypothetical protein QM664_00265 [Flavihumibacter sp.]